jgi:hypothetical protein
VVTQHQVGGCGAARVYRHPLVASIIPFFNSLNGRCDGAARRAVRWTPVAASLAAVLMSLDAACPLMVRCEEALACLKVDFTRRRRVGGTYNGLVKALERQAATVLPLLKDDLRRQCVLAMRKIRRTRGWTLLAVDGSKEELPRTRDHERMFGIADNGAFPQAFVTAIVEVTTGLLWDWRIGRSNASEKHHLREMIERLPQNALLLADGNFVGYPLWSALQEASRSFLIRVGGNIGLIQRLCPQARIERRADIVYVWPAKHQVDHPPLRLRLIRVGSWHEPVFLLTNVLDHRRLNARTASSIYRTRWGVEVFYRTFKRTMGCVKLRSRAGRRAWIELEWGLIAATIVTLLGIEALHRARRDVGRLSPAGVLRILQAGLRRGQVHSSTARGVTQMRQALGCAMRDQYRRRGPKHARHRPPTKNTPKPLRLKPPRLRLATRNEQQLALRRHPALAA